MAILKEKKKKRSLLLLPPPPPLTCSELRTFARVRDEREARAMLARRHSLAPADTDAAASNWHHRTERPTDRPTVQQRFTTGGGGRL